MTYDDFKKIEEETKKAKFDSFQNALRDSFMRDKEMVSKVYSRDKDDFTLKVCSLKNGGYAVVRNKKEILYKNNDVHLCKVEWIMLTQDMSMASMLMK